MARVEIERTPRQGRGFVAAAALLTAIATAGVVVATWNLASGGPARAHARPRAPVTLPSRSPLPSRTATPAVAGAAAGCWPLSGGSQAVPTTTPADTRWVLVGDMAEPSAPATFGPERRVDGFGECYAHSPTGALFAAVNMLAASTAAPASVLLEQLAAPSPARSLAVRQAQETDPPLLAQVVGGAPSLVGFSFSSYSPAQADITLAFALPDGGSDVAQAGVLVWEGGDWRSVVSPGGLDGGPPTVELASLDGFVPWGAG
jgi:hypothetical protein